MATIPEIEARIHALWAKGDARTIEESVELGRLLTALETEMPPGDFYKHVWDVLHIPAHAAQQFMQQYHRGRPYSSAAARCLYTGSGCCARAVCRCALQTWGAEDSEKRYSWQSGAAAQALASRTHPPMDAPAWRVPSMMFLW